MCAEWVLATTDYTVAGARKALVLREAASNHKYAKCEKRLMKLKSAAAAE